ncbi:MAG: sugar ABC transporter ATP-binding protein [Treponemataceae bacterium]
MGETLLSAKEIRKAFGGIHALKGVSVDIGPGEILALVGENGAGKSTLAKIISGVYSADSGSLTFAGKEVSFKTASAARAAGISIVLQEFNLIPHLSVAENVYLTAREAYKGGVWLDRKRINEKTAALMKDINIDLDIDPGRIVGTLSVAEQQLVEIVKAVSVQSRLLILDEPTATLTQQETAKLFTLVRRLRKDGLSIVFVSHRIEEILDISDRIVVFRDGEKVREFVTKGTKADELITAMVGRDIGDLFAIRKRREPGEVLLEVSNVTRGKRVIDCSLQVRRGEVVGLSGLVGAGRTELSRIIFGADKADSGEMILRGNSVMVGSPSAAIKRGVGMVPEDRKSHGLFINLPIYQNVMLSYHVKNRGFWISANKERDLVDKKVEELRIKVSQTGLAVSSLSGGNQQKVVLAKWLLSKPDLLILDEPTRGIDIGAKFEIYHLIDALAASGVAILLVSSELPEIIALSDRILVMKQGRIVKALSHGEATEELILSHCA